MHLIPAADVTRPEPLPQKELGRNMSHAQRAMRMTMLMGITVRRRTSRQIATTVWAAGVTEALRAGGN